MSDLTATTGTTPRRHRTDPAEGHGGGTRTGRLRAWWNSLVGAIGVVVASVPFLLRLRRRFDSWWAPAIGLAVFAAMFSLSAFVIGPAISGGGGAPPGGGQPGPAIDHSGHHG